MELLKYSEKEVYLAADLRDESRSAAFQGALRNSYYISPVRTSNQAEPYVTVSVPIRTGPRKVTGALVASANLKFLWEVIGASTFATAGYSYLVDETGRLIAHRDPSLVLKGLDLHELPKVRRFLQSHSVDSEAAEDGPGIGGSRVLSTYARVPGFGWGVIVEEPVEVALADLQRLHAYALLLVVMGLMTGAIVIVWVSRRITRPIQQLHGSITGRRSRPAMRSKISPAISTR
jgi:hypothetical protein